MGADTFLNAYSNPFKALTRFIPSFFIALWSSQTEVVENDRWASRTYLLATA